MFLPEFFKDDLHHVIFAVVGKIHINVRQLVQRHALMIDAPGVAEVAATDDAGKDYAEPVQFFARTYLTEGLRVTLAKIKATMVSCGSVNLREFHSSARLTLVSQQSFEESHPSVIVRDTAATVA